MNAERRAKAGRRAKAVFVLRSALYVLSLLIVGCGSPSTVNIQLRKENQKLSDQIVQLKRERDGDLATIRGYEQSRPTVATLNAAFHLQGVAA